MSNSLHCLLIGPVETDLEKIKSCLEATSLRIEAVSVRPTLEEASDLLKESRVDFVFLNIYSTYSTNLDLLAKALSLCPGTPVIVLCEDGGKDMFEDALAMGASDCLQREDCHPALLERAIRLVLQRRVNVVLKKHVKECYQVFFDRNPLPTWAFEPHTLKIRFVNDAAIRHYGYSRQEFLNLTIRDLRKGKDLIEFERFMESFDGKPYDSKGTHWRHIKKDGEEIDVEITAEHIRVDAEDLVLAVITDVTERNAAFRKMQDSNDRLDFAISAGRMAMLDVNYETGGIRLSTKNGSVAGVSGDSVVNLDKALELVHPEDRLKLQIAFELGKIGKREDVQFRILRPDNGKVMWLERRSSLVFNNAGEPMESRGIVVDITALKETQDYLLDSFRQLEDAASQQSSILNSLPAHIALLNSEGTIIAVNEAWRKFAHDNGLPGRNYCEGECYFAEAANDEEAENFYNEVRRVIAGNKLHFQLEYACHAPDKRRWFKAIVSPLVTKERRGAVIMHIDITDRKTAEEELIRSRANLLSIFQHTPDAYVLLDPEYNVVAANAQALRDFHFLHGTEPVGKNIIDLLPDDRVEEFTGQIAGAAAGVPVEYSAVYNQEFEGKRYFQVRIIPILSDVKFVLGFAICAHEVTRQKQIENTLRDSEEHFRALIENSGDMFCVTDEQNRITYISPNIKKLLNYEMRELLMQPFDNLLHEDDRQRYHEVLEQVKSTKNKLFHETKRIRDRDGRYMWVEGTMINLRDVPSIRGVVSNFRDVTSRLQTENELKRNEYLLAKAHKVAKIGYWVVDLKAGNAISWSPELLDLFGLRKDNCPHTVEDANAIIHSDDVGVVKNAMDAAIAGRRDLSFDHRIIRPDGRILWFHEQGEVFFDEVGHPASIIGVAKDITERKEIEESIRHAKNNLDALINNTTDLLWSCDRKLRLVSANRAFLQGVKLRHGIDLREGQNLLLINTDPDEYTLWSGKYHQVLEGERVNFEVEATDGQGKVYYYEVTLNPIIDSGRVEGVSGLTRDITEKKEIENAMFRTNERFELLSLATNDAVWDWNIGTNNIQWNHGLQSIYGHTLSQRKSTVEWWEENVHPLDIAVVKQTLALAFTNRSQHWSATYRFRLSDGSYRHTHDRGYVIYEQGNPVRMIGAMQDVHELTEYRVALEQKVFERTRELRQALEKEKELSEMKNRFVSIASHEFRTPLSTIQFAADYLGMYRSRLTDGQVTKKLESIQSQVNHMMSLLDDVLTVGKADSGHIQVNRSMVNVKNFFTDLISNVRCAAKSSHEVLASFDLATDVFETDEKLLHNIFNNLLSNAMKFSPGEREVALWCSQNDKELVFHVADNGIGIRPDEVNSIFEPFSRGTNVGAISGTGLGLSIVRTAVTLLNGSLEVHRDSKFKTIFTVRLPLHSQGIVMKDTVSHG